WGGYWGWDPVENASLLPWLIGTAFIHSVMIQEKRGMLKVWNASLVLATGTLAILGTFLVRSGILESIHAFGASTLGTPFLILIGLMTVGSIVLVVLRRSALRSEHRLDSLLSREAVFFVQNLILVALAFVVFWGTFFPLISEAVTGTKASVGPPWFNRYTVPLALVLVLLSGAGPLLAWRRVTVANLRRSFIAPTAIALAVMVVLLLSGVGERPLALAMFVFATFVVGAVGQEFVRGVKARRVISGESPPVALVSLVRRNRRRYGGYTVHVGFAVLMVGVAASSAFAHPRDVRLSPGQSAQVDGYKITYVRPTTNLANEKISLGAIVDVSKDGKQVARLEPSRNYYPSRDVAGLGVIGRFFEGEATSEVGLKSGLTRDIWTAVSPDLNALMPFIAEADKKFAKAGPDLQGLLVTALTERYLNQPPPAQFRFIISPLVMWIWIGGLIVVGGALIAMWPASRSSRRRASAGAAARVARDLGRA
ncbi:MAG: cytochrome c biogenesis protein CcsA, partial [Solirubrobacterales bacterium]|nr:cytochrome c biogenesis protein CcsA [Solirubrobacterales bacterium]